MSTQAIGSSSDQFSVLTDLPSNIVVENRTFGFNPDLGRAWVEMHYREPHFEEYPAERLRVAIDGLVYDSESQAVVLQAADDQTVCATLEARGYGFFQRQDLVPTGACRLSLSEQPVTRDDGFDIWSEQLWTLTLELAP